jgi:hypothetical protein
VIWLLGRKQRDTLRVEVRVHLGYRFGALAEVITIVTARHVIITDFSAEGANPRLRLGELHVDLSLLVQESLHKDSLLGEIRAAGFSYQEKPASRRRSNE